MKKVLFPLISAVLLASCGGGGDSKTKADSAKTTDITKDPAYQKGLDLIAHNDCFTCHQIDDKVNGPAYRDVANKYASMPDTIVAHLAHKVREGGSGVWGQLAMTPHPALSEEDAESIVRYILLLKK